MADQKTQDAPPPPLINTPFTMKCVKSQQAGFDILSGVCKCGRHVSVNGPGELYCSCGQLMVFAEPS